MNRVRVVALSAVVLGAAVVVGTRFQQSGAPADVAAAPAAETAIAAALPAPDADDGAAAPSLTALASAPQAAATPAGPISLTAPSRTADPRVPQPSIAAPLFSVAQPGLSLASVVPGPMPQPDTLRSLADAGSGPAAPALDPTLQAELASCAVWLVVTPAPGAMLETSVYAPCDGGAAITLTHAGLNVDLLLAEDGQLLAQIPALTDQATVTLHFADGREQSDQTQVPDLGTVERVVIQWQAPASFSLNAYEFGAGYGDAGHVFPGAPRTAGVTDQGFLTVLGDPTIDGAHMAQIYSYPRGESPRTGRVALEIEAPVTDTTCGRPLFANTIELHGTASAQVRQIRLDMPDCDGQGGYLVLPGVLPELQIALAN